MIEERIDVDTGNDKILDLDSNDKGDFIAYTKNNRVLTNNYNFKIDKSVRFPIIRRVDFDRFLIVDGRSHQSFNGYLYNFSGEFIKSFYAGYGIRDIIVHKHKIINIYFDEGIARKSGPNNDGLSIFDFEGNQLFGYNSSAKGETILDCYCICKHGTNSVLFYPYPALKVYELNLDNLTLERFNTPDEIAGVSAISSVKNTILTHSNYHETSSFFSWDRKRNQIVKLGKYSTPIRGIKNGKFLSYDSSGFTIINPVE